MAEAQIGTIGLPIFLIPRIKGLPVTVEDIKLTYSNRYISDLATPMKFYLQLQARDEDPIVVEYTANKSTNSILYFLPADSVYAEIKVFTLLWYWKVTTSDPEEVLEQIWTEEPVILDVKDLNNVA